MKMIMSCSSLSSIIRSLGLLFRVSMIKWCRSMPVESVYSTLDSDRTNSGQDLLLYTKIQNHTAISSIPEELHQDRGRESRFIAFLNFICFVALFYKISITHIYIPLDRDSLFGSVLLSCSSSLQETLLLSWQLDDTSASGDVLHGRKTKSNLSLVIRINSRWMFRIQYV